MSIKDCPARVDEIKTKIKPANGGKEHSKTSPLEFNKTYVKFWEKEER